MSLHPLPSPAGAAVLPHHRNKQQRIWQRRCILPRMQSFRSVRCALLAVVFSALQIRPAIAEDMQLRARAVELLNGPSAASVLHPTGAAISTVANFTATADDGTLKSGTYTRLRTPDGKLRQEVRFADWQATNLILGREVVATGPWNFPPFAVRRLFSLVPFRTGQFDHEDVVRLIRDGSALGEQATCIDYDTVHGEHHSANEVCVGKASGHLLSVREDGGVYEYSQYSTVAGATYPQHIDYRESATGFSLSVDLALTSLDSVPADAMTPPPGVGAAVFCDTASPAVPRNAPQPQATGGPDAPVTDVAVRVWINPDGSVTSPEVVHPQHPELDAEALKLAQTWVFEAATCNGKPNGLPADIVLHFQRRN